MYHIAVIGTGNLGRRHLQALVRLNVEKKLYAVDTDCKILKLLEEEFSVKEDLKIAYMQRIEELPSHMDLVIVSTSSNVRRSVFEELISHTQVEAVIFEKVLFQRVEDYYFVAKRLQENHIKAWVNCARREWDSYNVLKERIKKAHSFFLSVQGGQWGMGCNGIHMLDLVEFLSDDLCSIDPPRLMSQIVESNRKGFFEIFGVITGNCGKCKAFEVACLAQSELPFMIEITAEDMRVAINEGKQEMYISEKENGWEWERKPFSVVYQSSLTDLVAKEILENGTCKLPDYEAAMRLHLKFIIPLICFFEEHGMREGVCPIT